MIEPCPDAIVDEVLAALHGRFGIDPEALSDRSFWQGVRERVFLGPPEVPDGVEPVTGATLLCRRQATIKPSTDFLQAFGDLVERNLVVVDDATARRYVAGEDLDRDAVREVEARTGWVLVRDEQGRNLGCALLREDVVENVVPKGRRLPPAGSDG